MRRMIVCVLVICGMTMLTPSTSIAHGKQDPNLDVQARPFAEQAAQIRTDLAGGDNYAEISNEDRNTVLGLITRMQTLLDNVDSVEALPEQSRLALLNDQE